jgi:hypothetical protein
MKPLVILRGLAFAACCFVVFLELLPTKAPAASPTNLGRSFYNVTDFGADNTGLTDARPAIQAAINSCDTAVGCEVHFPAGVYAIYTPAASASGVITVPANVPITLSGSGQSSALIEPQSYAASPINYNIIYVAPGATGFTMHDLGVYIAGNLTPSNGAISGSILDLPAANTVSVVDSQFQGAYDAIELGQTNASSNNTRNVNISAVTSQSGNHCFLRLDGGVVNTFIRGVYAEGGNMPNSAILCLPSSDNSSGSSSGVTGLYITGSIFRSFTRGITIPAWQLRFEHLYLDNLFIATANNGAAFEVFAPPNSPALTSELAEIRLSNSYLASAATACVVHGAASAIKMLNDTCVGGSPASLPTPCGSGTSQRGYAMAEITGVGSPTQTISVTAGTPTVTVTFHPGLGESASNMASDLGKLINSSALVTASCPMPTPCATGPFPRGYALLELGSSGTTTGTIGLHVTSPGAPTVSAAFMVGSSLSAEQIATGFGAAINASALVTASCPPLVPLQTYATSVVGAVGPDASIGPDIELYSYAWGSSVTPQVTVTSYVNGPYVKLLGIAGPMSTFAPADSLYVGTPSTPQPVTVGTPQPVPYPSGIVVTGTTASQASNGAGLHLQGGGALLFMGNRFGAPGAQNLNGVQIDTSAVSYLGVVLQKNDLQYNMSSPLFFNNALQTPPTPGPPVVLSLGQNVGYNPVGYQTPSPIGGCSSPPLTNPFPTTEEIYVQGAFTSILKNGQTVYSGGASGSVVEVTLGIDETIQIVCMGTPPSLTWFGE